MRCPNCGTLMNRHAEKPLKGVRLEEPVLFDADLDGVVSAIHNCAGCGKVEAEIESLQALRANTGIKDGVRGI